MDICKVCDETLGEDYTVRSNKSFHVGCAGKLENCQSCSKQMVKRTSDRKVCLSCGKSKTFIVCSDCKKGCENGALIDSEIICSFCQERREEKRTGMKKCSSCRQKFYARDDPLNCHTYSMCLSCAVGTAHYTTEFVDSMY